MEKIRTAWITLRIYALMTVLLGVLYPVAIFAVGQVASAKADGSWIELADGSKAGSTLIAQPVTKEGFFYPRPSAAGEEGYDALSSSASNASPYAKDLQDLIATRRQEIAQREGVSGTQVPVDAVTASGSGLDPHISEAYARLQAPRVAQERKVDEKIVNALIDQCRELTLTGSSDGAIVNVVKLNFELTRIEPAPR